MSESLSDLLSFALTLARAAEDHILPHYRRVESRTKADGTEVTIADRMAEKVMRNLIASRYPHHGILGEELGYKPSLNEKYTWVLDPIDGTAWFTIGAPLFGTLIGLLEFGKPVLGVVHLPALQETLYAATGLGCWLDVAGSSTRQVHVAPPISLQKATVLASGIHGTSLAPRNGSDVFDLGAISSCAEKLKFYGDCVQHALVCRGHVHAAMDTLMRPWDIAAFVPCIEEAGGVITSLSGESQNILQQETILTSCCSGLHDEIVRAVAPRSHRCAIAG